MNRLEEFTQEVRDFLERNLTPEFRHFGEVCPGYSCPLPVAAEWTRILDDQGWSVPAWPIEHGGTGWSGVNLYVELTPEARQRDPEKIRADILEFCQAEMASYKVPKVIHLVDAMPLTAVGKIDKKVLREQVTG